MNVTESPSSLPDESSRIVRPQLSGNPIKVICGCVFFLVDLILNIELKKARL